MFMLKKERKNLCVEMIQGNNGIHFPIKKKRHIYMEVKLFLRNLLQPVFCIYILLN